MKTKISEKNQYFSPAGVICELNPPHFGHENLFRRAKNGASALVCVMSGNFVQRGEPSVYPKHHRARCALEMGADLVVELPVPFAVSSAETFARTGVRILHALNVKTLAFGSECGDVDALVRAADALDSPDAVAALRENLGAGQSYASARQNALNTVHGETADILKTPNNLLGIEYIRALRYYSAGIAPQTFPRTPNVSSSQIRELLRSGDGSAWDKIPEQARGILTELKPVFAENLEVAILSRLRAMDFSAYAKVPGGSDGVAERAFRAVKKCGSLAELEASVKTKRYAMSRVRRYILACALGLRAETEPPYVRVLALNERGGEILRASTLPVVTKPASARKSGGEILRFMEIESGATDFYTLAGGAPPFPAGGEWRISAHVRR